MRYFALACDYDGTIAHDGSVDEQTVAALRLVKESGRRLVLVTGRELRELKEIFPHLDLFEWAVVENGAVLYHPATHKERPLAEPPPPEFFRALAAEGVPAPSVGRCIVATHVPHETGVLAAIRRTGLELQVIFNKGSVMVLPSGVNKATGLMAALIEMRLSPRNVVAVGDAENDHAFLKIAECGVAVADALPMLRETADFSTRSASGEGMRELIQDLVSSDLSEHQARIRRRDIPLGHRKNDDPVLLPPHGLSLMVAGTSGGGKSTLVTGLLERFAETGYQFCLIDPEGDYENLPGAITLGDSKRPPTVAEVVQLLEHPDQNAVVDLVGLALEHRPEFVGRLLPALLQLRIQTGRPHWIVIDETHHFCPADWAPTTGDLLRDLRGLILITVHPDHVARTILQGIELVVAIGKSPGKTIASFSHAVGDADPRAPNTNLEPGDGIAWRRRPFSEVFWFRSVPPKAERQRHRRKYAEGVIDEDHVFYFRGPDDKLKLRAHNVMVFLQLAEGVDVETWEFHLREGDYAEWFREALGDDELAADAERIAATPGLSPEQSRAEICAAVRARYTGPA